MAIDTTNLVYLIDPFWQGENNNGRPLVGGHMEVYLAGTDTKYITWQNWDGTKNPFKIPLGSDGRATILVEPEYTYDCYLYDSFNNLAVSRLNVKPNIGGDVYGLSQVYHDETLTGNGTVTSPLGMVSAKLGVQEPLYFVQDDSATVIGLRESAYSGLPYVENSALGYGMAGMQPFISSISGLGFYALSANSASIADSASLANSASLAGSASIADSASISYSAENAGLVTDGWETGSDGRITAYNGTAFSAGKVYSGISPVYVDNEHDQIGVSSKDFLANSPLYFTEYDNRVELSISGLPPTPGLMYESGFNYESGKITGYNGSGISAGKVYSGISPVTVDNVNDTISVTSAILGVQAPLFFVEDSESATIIGLNTAQIQIDIPESANWNEAYSTVNNNSATWNSAADVLAVLNTAKWDDAANTLSSNSADWNNKLDSSIYANDSGNFLTALPSDLVYTADIQDMATTGDINDLVTSISETYQTTAGMTAYATTNYVDSSVSGKYDTSSFSAISGDFLTTADSSEFYPMTGNPSGFLTTETDWSDTITAASAYAYSEATAQIPTDYATTAQLADKLDSAIYANDSATFVTSLPGSANWNKAYFEILAHSANWNDVSAKLDIGTYSTDSAKFLTAHQALPQSADWNSAASTVSAGYTLWDAAYGTLTANSANWDASYATLTGNSANWLTAVPAGTMNESNFGYDTANNITAYNGSAFKAGGEFPQSATEAIEVVTGGSANWNSTTATVSTNSGAWGGSGIEISAGFGIDIQMVDNKLVISLATATGDI